jgi:polyisoprenoid-binding protein YceI
MLTKTAPIATLALAAVGVAGLVALPQPEPAKATTTAALATSYAIDPVHSTVVFSALYLGQSPFYGMFTESSGSMTWDGSSTDSFSLEVVLPMDAIDTHNATRDGHLKSAEWFNARQFPTVTFRGSELTDDGDGTYTLQGELTLHGQTRDIEADVTHLAARETPRGVRMGVGATFTVNRSDFGVTTMLGDDGISDEITLHVGLQGVAQ